MGSGLGEGVGADGGSDPDEDDGAVVGTLGGVGLLGDGEGLFEGVGAAEGLQKLDTIMLNFAWFADNAASAAFSVAP